LARIQTPQHVQELQAEFKVREPFGLELLESIQPTYSLGRQKIASVGYPKKAIAIVSASAGGVGTNIECALRCPADIGIVISLDEIWLNDLGGSVTMRITDGTAMATISSTPTDKAWRDARVTASQPQGVTEIANPLTAAPNGRLIAIVSCLTDDTKIFKPKVILGGDAYFLVRRSSSNSGLTLTFLWTEFLLEDR